MNCISSTRLTAAPFLFDSPRSAADDGYGPYHGARPLPYLAALLPGGSTNRQKDVR